MKVLISDKFESDGIEKLKLSGCDVSYQPELKGDALTKAISDSACRALIVRSCQVTKNDVTAGRQLGLIVRAGAGYNTIDVTAASEQSVFVANCPGKNAAAVAELTMGLMLSLDRRIPDNVIDLRQGKWSKKEYSKAKGISGRTLGIIGMGQIGELVAARAKAFGMKVVAWSRSLTSSRARDLGIIRLELPEEVAATCDVLSVHLAATPDTKSIIGKNIFDELKPGAFFINTSRAEVVDYKALQYAVSEKAIRVGLDVFDREPAAADNTFDDPFIKSNGVIYGTHHIGASTDQAQQAVADEVVDIIREYMNSGHVMNCVNLSMGASVKGVLMVRHRNQPGVLAHVLGELSRAGINVREMENVICEDEKGACAQIRLDSRPDDKVIQRIENSDNNILGLSLMTPH